MRLRAWICALTGGALATLATVAWVAPAQWADRLVQQLSSGRVGLAAATGTVWNGQAILVLASGDYGTSRAALPEPLAWHLAAWPLLTGTVELTVRHPAALQAPVRIDADSGGHVRLGPMTLRLPANLLDGLGAPWNTVRPGGMLTFRTQGLSLSSGRVQGSVSAEWDHASSALTPVAPIGRYRLETSGQYPGMAVDLQTLSGPLELSGSGTIAEGGRVHFSGIARPQAAADPAVRTQLAGLISLLGRRQGDAAILSLGS